MTFWSCHFAVTGVETFPLLPPPVAFLISFFTPTAGISGAFLPLPFQVSVPGFSSPAVTATNFLYNVAGTPGGFLRYLREKRIVWPLAAGIICGTLPGLLAGMYCGARWRKRVSEKWIKLLLVGVVVTLASKYITQYFYSGCQKYVPIAGRIFARTTYAFLIGPDSLPVCMEIGSPPKATVFQRHVPENRQEVKVRKEGRDTNDTD